MLGFICSFSSEVLFLLRYYLPVIISKFVTACPVISFVLYV